MKRADVVTSTRLAGSVRRYHSWPVLRTQTVAEHSWQVARLFRELFPDAWCLEVADWIQMHDMPEIGTGDVPFPLKARYPELKSIYMEIEGDVCENLGIVWPELTPRQRLLTKVADLLEMWEYGREELMMGNKYAEPIIADTAAAVWELTVKEPGSLHSYVMDWMMKRKDRV